MAAPQVELPREDHQPAVPIKILALNQLFHNLTFILTRPAVTGRWHDRSRGNACGVSR